MKTRHYKTLRGLLRAMESQQINLNQMRQKRIYHKSLGWINIIIEESVEREFYEGICGVVWSQVNEERIFYVSTAPYYGIFDRLCYDIRYNKYEYIAGQDYRSEIRCIQRLLK